MKRNAITELKHELSEGWKSIAGGWHQLRARATDALTRFKPTTRKPSAAADADLDVLASPHWGLLAGEVFEDWANVIVRLEAPGLDSADFNVQVVGAELRVTGEKRASRERSDGVYRVMECAYGSFQRSIPLPAPVQADRAEATYRNGVLRVVLPKTEAAKPRRIAVTVH